MDEFKFNSPKVMNKLNLLLRILKYLKKGKNIVITKINISRLLNFIIIYFTMDNIMYDT